MMTSTVMDLIETRDKQIVALTNRNKELTETMATLLYFLRHEHNNGIIIERSPAVAAAMSKATNLINQK